MSSGRFRSGKPAGAPALAVMAVPGFGDQVQSGRRSAASRLSALGFRKPARESRKPVFTGSVVGIQFEVVAMYTGTLISELMMTAERVSGSAEQQIKEELHEIFTMQIPINDGQVYQGAA